MTATEKQHAQSRWRIGGGNGRCADGSDQTRENRRK